MSRAFSTRRRAEEFDRLVEASRRGAGASAPGSGGGELGELAVLAASLRDVPAVTPRPAFSADLRERLMAAAATELAHDTEVTERLTIPTRPEARRRRDRRLTVGIAALAIVGASAGTALASQGALPGEPLYPVKRAIENVRTGFTTSDSGKGSVLLGDAGTRLDEVAKLSRGSDDNSAEITKTLDAFSEQATKASDLLLSTYQQHRDTGSIEKLQKFAAASIDQLTVLEPLVPDGAKQALTEAAQTVLTIDTAAHNACPACGGNPITSLPESLLTPVASTLGSLTKSLGTRPADTSDSAPTTEKGGKSTGTTRHTLTLPSVPADVGPANVAPSSKPAAQEPSTTTTEPTAKSNPITKLLPPKPTSAPTSLGETVQDVTDGLTGTVDGVLGTVGDVVGGLLGTNKSKAP